jgi:hypothetical protein
MPGLGISPQRSGFVQVGRLDDEKSVFGTNRPFGPQIIRQLRIEITEKRTFRAVRSQLPVISLAKSIHLANLDHSLTSCL